MIRDNRFYGHAEILREYCGLRRHAPIPARLQHGWTLGPGLAEQYMEAPYPKLIWSRRNLALSEEQGYRSVIPIGAPFLYLPALPPSAPADDQSLLAFPFHGTDGRDVLGGLEPYANALLELRRERFNAITVCLYFLDYDNPAVRALFEDRGFKVVTAGHRDGNPEFLHRLRGIILEHACTTSNRIGSAAFYSMALDRPFFLFGPPGTLAVDLARYADVEKKLFPRLTFEQFNGDCHRDIAAYELGEEFRLAPMVLRELMGWRWSGVPLHAIRWAQHLTNVAWRRARRIPPP